MKNTSVVDKLLDLAVKGEKDLVKELLPLVVGTEQIQPTSTVRVLPFEVGKQYFIRTVTYHSTGRVKAIVGDYLILEKGAWIADSGRLNDALKKGFDKVDSAEIEPYELEWMINTGSIVDACEYPYQLPDDQK